MPSNNIKALSLKDSIRRQSFFFDAAKHGFSKAMGGTALLVARYGFNLPWLTAAVPALATDTAIVTGIDLVAKPLFLQDKIVERAAKKAE